MPHVYTLAKLTRTDVLQAINAVTEAEGYVPCARLPSTLWGEICRPLQGAVERIARQRLLASLRHLGDTAARDFPANADYALRGVLRESHRKFAPAPELAAGLAAMRAAGKLAQFESDLGRWFGSLLVDEPFSYARAEAGAEEPSTSTKTSTTAAAPQTAAARQTTSRRAKTVNETTTSKAAAIPPLPSFEPEQEKASQLDKLVRKGFGSAADEHLVKVVIKTVGEYANRLLALRDRVLQLRMHAIKRDIKTPATAPAEETPEGKTIKGLMKAMEGHLASGEKLSAELWVLDAQVRRMAGRPDSEIVPVRPERCNSQKAEDKLTPTGPQSFAPTFLTVNTSTLLLILEPKQGKPDKHERLGWIIEDAEAIACAQLSPLLQQMERTKKSVLLDPMKDLFVPTEVTWSAIERDPHGFDNPQLKLRERFEFEMLELARWLRGSLSQPFGSLNGTVTGDGLSAEVVNLLVDRAALPANYLPTGPLYFSASALRMICVDIGAVHRAEFSQGTSLGTGTAGSRGQAADNVIPAP